MVSTHTVSGPVRQDWRQRKSIRQIGFTTGFTIYLLSFLLPAVNGGASSSMIGWVCAELALTMPFSRDYVDSNLFKSILFACGLINILVLAYVVLWTHDANPILRRVIAVVALSFIPLNWIYMAHDPPGLTPEIGHIAWITGLILIFGPEAVLGRANRT